MAVNVEEVVITLSGKTDGIQASVDKANQKLDEFGNRAKKNSENASASFAKFGEVVKVALSVEALRKFIDFTTEFEQANKRIEAVIRATGGAAGQTADDIERLANKFAGTTLFDDKQIKEAAATMLTFKNVTSDTFERALSLSVDLAAAFKTDVSSAAFALGKALDLPAEGVDALRRAGVKLTDQQKDQVIALDEIGKRWEAQNMLLDIVKSKVEGTAEAMHSGLSGAIHDLGQDFEDLEKAIGDGGATVVLTKIFQTLSVAVDFATIAIDSLRYAWAELAGTAEDVAEVQNDLYDIHIKTRDAIAELTGGIKVLTEEEVNAKKAAGEYATQITFLNEVTDRGGAAAVKQAKAIKDSAEEMKKAKKEAEDFGKKLEELSQDLQNDIVKVGLTPTEKKLADVNNMFQKNAKSMELMGEKGDELKARILAQTETLGKLEEQQKANEEEARKMQAAFDHAFENIQDEFAKMIETGKFSFDSLVDMAKKAAAQIAAAMAMKAIGGMAGSIANAAGYPETGSMLGGSGSGGGMDTVTSGASLLKGVMNSQSIFGSGITSTLDSFGAANLGTANVSSSFVGPLPQGMTAGTTLSGYTSGALGGLGFGAAVGSLNPWAKNQQNSQIGGALGGAAGSVIGTAVGATSGIAMGATMGSIVPGIGTVIGAVLGALLGGMLGPGAPHPASEFSTNFNSMGGTVGANVASKHVSKEAGQAALDSVAAIAATLGSIGVDLSKVSVRGGQALVRGGAYFEVGGNKQISFAAGDAAATDTALKELIVQLTEVGNVTNDDVNKALKNLVTEGKTATDVMNELAFAYAKPTLKKELEDALNLDIRKITDPIGVQVEEVNAQFDELLARATLLGADVSLVEKLRQLTLDQITGVTDALNETIAEATRLAEQFARVADQLSDTLNDALFGESSTLSAQDQYAAARAQFDTIAQSASGGDIGAMQQLSNAFKTFIGESRNVNASGATYTNDFNYGTSVLQNAMNLAASQAMAYGVQSGHAGAGQTDLSGISAALNAMAKAQTQTNAIIKTIATDSSGRRVA